MLDTIRHNWTQLDKDLTQLKQIIHGTHKRNRDYTQGAYHKKTQLWKHVNLT